MRKYLTFKNLVVALAVLRLAVFCSFFFSYGVDKLNDYPDSDHYWGLAKSIHDNWSFVNNEIVAKPEALTFNQPNAFRTPGYPAVLSVFWNFGDQGYIFIPGLQFLLGLAAVYLLYRLAKLIFSVKVAQTAAVLLLLDPTFLTVNFLILSDTLFIVFFLGFLWLAIRFLNGGPRRFLLLSALFLALTILIRPVVIYVPVVVLMVLIYHFRQSFQKLFVNVLFFILLTAAFLSPWYVRNYLDFGQIFLTTLPSYNNWRYNIGFWSGESDLAGYWQAAQAAYRAETGQVISEFADYADPANLAYYQQKTREFLSSHFWLAVKHQAKRMALETIDPRYYNHISQLYRGQYYDKGYSQLLASADKLDFIKHSWTMLLSSLIVFLLFVNFVRFYFVYFFHRRKMALEPKAVSALLLLGLLIAYFYLTGAPGNIERYLLPLLILEYLIFAHTLVNFKRLIKHG